MRELILLINALFWLFCPAVEEMKQALRLMECWLGLDLPISVGFIAWVFGFVPKSWGSVWLNLSKGFIYLLWAGLLQMVLTLWFCFLESGPYFVVRT